MPGVGSRAGARDDLLRGLEGGMLGGYIPGEELSAARLPEVNVRVAEGV